MVAVHDLAEQRPCPSASKGTQKKFLRDGVGISATVPSLFVLQRPMPTTRSSTLRAAAEVVGGPASLAAALGVSEPQAQRWISGEEPVPAGIFLQAVDLLERHDRRKERRPAGNDTQPGHG